VRENYILDTSTIIYDPKCFKTFSGNNVIIPLKVLEELDGVKNKMDFGGANARRAIRVIDEYFKDCSPSVGVEINNGIHLMIDNSNKRGKKFDRVENDDVILSCAARHKNSVLVSRDIAMRLRARAFGLQAQDYVNDKIILEANDIFTGNRNIVLEEYYEGFDTLGLDDCKGTVFESLYPNECVQVEQNNNNRIYRKKADGSIRPILQKKRDAFGLKSRNKEQAYALELLLDPTVNLVSLIGKSGCGKTLLSIAAAIECVLEDGIYDKIEVYRPIVSVGNDLGYLPGTAQEKLDPWFGAIKNALEVILPKKVSLDEFLFMNKNRIMFEAISYIRGKSLNNTFIIVDEAQNLSKGELKAIITRTGYNAKICLTGDIEQIDGSYLDESSNGLSYVVEKFKSSKLSGHMLLTKGERSDLASEAAMIL